VTWWARLSVLFFGLFMIYEQPVFATHESPLCQWTIEIQVLPDDFYMPPPYGCTEISWDVFLLDDGWIEIRTPLYGVMIQLPDKATDGYVIYTLGRGYAVYMEKNRERKLPAYIFMREWI